MKSVFKMAAGALLIAVLSSTLTGVIAQTPTPSTLPAGTVKQLSTDLGMTAPVLVGEFLCIHYAPGMGSGPACIVHVATSGEGLCIVIMRRQWRAGESRSHFELSRAQVRELRDLIANRHFEQFRDYYRSGLRDVPSYRVTVLTAGGRKSIGLDMACREPDALRIFEVIHWIEKNAPVPDTSSVHTGK